MSQQKDVFSGEFITLDEPLKPLLSKGFKDPCSLILPISSIAASCLQFSLPFHTIRLDKGLCLAPHGLVVKKTWAIRYAEEYALVDELLNEFKQSAYAPPRRFHKQKHKVALSMLLANCLNAQRSHCGLIIPRGNTHSKLCLTKNPLNITPQTTSRIAAFLANEGLITLHIGKSNEYEGNASWLAVNDSLAHRLDYCKARIILANGTPLITLKNSKTTTSDAEYIPLPTSNGAKKEARRLSKPVRTYNSLWLEHRLTYAGSQLVPFLQRKFNNGSLALGGRWYGAGYQQLPSIERKRLLIDGERTVDLDYSSLHYNLLYAWAGATAPDKPYEAEGFSRNTIKRVSLVFLNSEDLTAFVRNVTKSGNPKVKRKMDIYYSKLEVYNVQRALGLKATVPYKPAVEKGFIKGMPDGIDGKELLEAIKQRHKPIKHFFGTKDIGLRLQFQDSEIIGTAIQLLADESIPVLPVHDSLRCKVRHKQIVRRAMLEAFKMHTGNSINIKSD